MATNTDRLIESYFRQKNILINHQIQSYNFYIDEIIPQIIKQYFPIIISLFSTPPSQVLGGFLFLSGLGLHFSFIEWGKDLTDDEDRNF